MADSLRLGAVTFHDVLEWEISICNLKNKQSYKVRKGLIVHSANLPQQFLEDKLILNPRPSTGLIITYLAHDINTAHQYLVNMPVFHQLCHIHQCMFKARPHPTREWVNIVHDQTLISPKKFKAKVKHTGYENTAMDQQQFQNSGFKRWSRSLQPTQEEQYS